MFVIYIEYHNEDGETSNDYAVADTRNECYAALEECGIDWRDVFYEAGGEFENSDAAAAFLEAEMYHVS